MVTLTSGPKSRCENGLAGKFPRIAARFPAGAAKSSDFGQNLPNQGLNEKNSLINSLQQGIALIAAWHKTRPMVTWERTGTDQNHTKNIARFVGESCESVYVCVQFLDIFPNFVHRPVPLKGSSFNETFGMEGLSTVPRIGNRVALSWTC